MTPKHWEPWGEWILRMNATYERRLDYCKQYRHNPGCIICFEQKHMGRHLCYTPPVPPDPSAAKVEKSNEKGP